MIELRQDDTLCRIAKDGAYIYELTEGTRHVLFPYAVLTDAEGNSKRRGGSHICLPNFGDPGNVPDLVQHGFGRDLPWDVITQSDAAVTLGLQGFGAYQGLEARLTYRLEAQALTTELTLRNTGETELQLAPGFHPYFPTTAGETEVTVDGETFALAKIIGTEFRDNVRELETADLRVTFETDNLSRFAIWTDQVGNYVCVEPTHVLNSFLVDPEESLRLAPGAEATFSYKKAWEFKA